MNDITLLGGTHNKTAKDDIVFFHCVTAGGWNWEETDVRMHTGAGRRSWALKLLRTHSFASLEYCAQQVSRAVIGLIAMLNHLIRTAMTEILSRRKMWGKRRLALYLTCLLGLASKGITIASGQTQPDYLGSETCKSCHSDIFEAWQPSHHAKAWMYPSEQTVDGDFDNATFEHRGRRTRFFRKGDKFLIETADVIDGPIVFEVKGVGGVAPLQQYLIETEPGRLQSFDVAWDQNKRVWYHLYPEQVLPPDDGYHWTGPYKNWNARCAECHATGFEKNYDARTRRYNSTQAEIGVGCEACHGPGEAHVAWAGAPNSFARDSYAGAGSNGLLISFPESAAETEIQQCAGCHSRREPFEDGNPLPGTPYHDTYRLALLREGLYHADGQILDEVYVYGSFLQSKMYGAGVRCSDCHDAHSAVLKAKGNAVCTQCHSGTGNTRFPSLALNSYDDPAHHFHEPGIAGAQCVSCHMIERTYMGIDDRRDHSFRIPRPDLSARLKTPNACTDCHTEETADWAADILETWFPDSVHRGQNFAEVFANARTGSSNVGGELLEIALHDEFPGIVRASALDLLQTAITPNDLKSVSPLLADSEPIVRAAAVSLLGSIAAEDRLKLLTGALEDPAKSVRIAAARRLLGIPIDSAPARTKRAAQAAQQEWQHSLAAKLDFPETHMAIGGTALVLRNPQAAIRAFQEVTTLDPQLADAWVMQVRLHMALRDFASAEIALQRALQKVPDNPTLLELKRQFTAQ